MAGVKKDSAEQTATNEDVKGVSLKNIGSCLIRINKVSVAPGDAINVTEEQLNSQAIKSLFHREIVEFEDDPKRTREFLAVIRKKVKAEVVKTIAQAEDGGTIK